MAGLAILRMCGHGKVAWKTDDQRTVNLTCSRSLLLTLLQIQIWHKTRVI